MSPLLILAIILILLFGGFGFAAHLLWLGLIVGVILIIADSVRGRRRL
jgi:hypothetical protein